MYSICSLFRSIAAVYKEKNYNQRKIMQQIEKGSSILLYIVKLKHQALHYSRLKIQHEG